MITNSPNAKTSMASWPEWKKAHQLTHRRGKQMIIQTRPVDRDGTTDFIGPCGKACQSISREGMSVELCQFCEVVPGWAECEIHCKESC